MIGIQNEVSSIQDFLEGQYSFTLVFIEQKKHLPRSGMHSFNHSFTRSCKKVLFYNGLQENCSDRILIMLHNFKHVKINAQF